MVMNLLIVLFTIVFFLYLGLFWFLFNKRLTSLEQSLQLIYKRIDTIFTVDLPSPNKATEEENKRVDLDEENMLPSDIKFEIEGGDEQIPPEYAKRVA